MGIGKDETCTVIVDLSLLFVNNFGVKPFCVFMRYSQRISGTSTFKPSNKRR